ncbi:MAG TPA: c-type cytochrome [Bacteroidetes bacterium]|nr:c-type cytochrome [Bacteroidota bacterium]
MFFILGVLVIFMAFLAMFYLNNMILQAQKMQLLEKHGLAAMEEAKLLDKESLWTRLGKKIWNRVEPDKEEDILFDHQYDGIRELDNVLPPWWVALFWGCIIYGFGYIGYYHMGGGGLSSAEEYEIEMKAADKAVRAHLASLGDQIDETNVELLTDESDLAIGSEIFHAKCTPCHGANGEGNSIGPNLTDEYWLHGGGIKNVFKTIKYGVPEKGMISWKSQIRAGDMQHLASYILSLQGSNPPNAKAPQGDKWEEQ